MINLHSRHTRRSTDEKQITYPPGGMSRSVASWLLLRMIDPMCSTA